MFSPKKEYEYKTDKISLKDFHDYKDKFILRPPYQRKANIWSATLREKFLDSLCRGYYIPKIVLRSVRFNDEDEEEKWEVVDGQQRITTIIKFYENDIKLPKSLEDFDKNKVLVGRTHEKLEAKQRDWFDKLLYLEADIITNIDSKSDPKHIKIASEIFWRLQQGEPLTFMETLHSRLYSNARNFISKYADEISFDFTKYEFQNFNRERHPFFSKIVAMKNNRMQQLGLLGRMLLLENAEGQPTELKPEMIEKLINSPAQNNNILDNSFEEKNESKNLLRLLNKFYEIFKDDVIVKGGGKVEELKIEYFILSVYLLLRHLDKYYAFDKEQYPIFRNFVSDFYQRWKKKDQSDINIINFRDNRQQSKENIEIRNIIIRQIFFTQNTNMMLKDEKRYFDESQRIAIYRRDRGLCKECISEGKNEKEALVEWSAYEADQWIS